MIPHRRKLTTDFTDDTDEKQKVTTQPWVEMTRKKVCVGVYTPTHTFFR